MKKPAFRFIVNREIRRVPLDWQHPRLENGQYIPLFPAGSYSESEIYSLLGEGKTLQEIASWQMPDFSNVPAEQLGLCVYETTSEGLPISPVFPNTPEGRWALVHYCAQFATVFANRKVNAEAWAELLFGDSLAVVDSETGRVLFDFEAKAA
jgi:hypothetical protein